MASPFDQSIHSGIYNPAHKTDLSYVYVRGTLPTPWPWLLGSFVLSLLLTMASFGDDESPSRSSKIISTVGVVYSMVRGIAVFATFAHATANTSIPSTSTIVLIIFSLIVYNGKNSNPRILTILSYLVVLALFILCTWKYYLGGNEDFFYGQYVLRGGTCPVVMRDCDPTTYRAKYFAHGCRAEQTYPDQPNHLSAGLPILEFSTGLFGFVYAGAYCVITVGYAALIWFRRQSSNSSDHGPSISLREKLFSFSKGPPAPPLEETQGELDNVTNQPRKNKSMLVPCGTITCCLMFFFAIPVVALTIFFQRKPGVNYYYDSSPPGVSANWTDCFAISPPNTKTGFWHEWVNEKNAKVARYIGFF